MRSTEVDLRQNETRLVCDDSHLVVDAFVLDELEKGSRIHTAYTVNQFPILPTKTMSKSVSVAGITGFLGPPPAKFL